MDSTPSPSSDMAIKEITSHVLGFSYLTKGTQKIGLGAENPTRTVFCRWPTVMRLFPCIPEKPLRGRGKPQRFRNCDLLAPKPIVRNYIVRCTVISNGARSTVDLNSLLESAGPPMATLRIPVWEYEASRSLIIGFIFHLGDHHSSDVTA